MSTPQPSRSSWLSRFAELHWYEATITFLFHFVAKTSELLLTAGIVVSTANFLTDGEILRTNQPLSLAWSWAQAIAIDSSLGVVCMNTIQAWRTREYVKAAFFLLLTLLLASVAGLITHFDALAHAAGLPVTDRGVSGIIPLWVMTALRALAVIGFLVASRLQQMSPQREETTLAQGHQKATTPQPQTIETEILVDALRRAMQQTGITSTVRITEESGSQPILAVPSASPNVQEPLCTGTRRFPEAELKQAQVEPVELQTRTTSQFPPLSGGNQPLASSEAEHLPFPMRRNEAQQSSETQAGESTGNRSCEQPEPQREVPLSPSDSPDPVRDARLQAAFLTLQAEGHRPSGTALANRAGVRKQTALSWLQHKLAQPSPPS